MLLVASINQGPGGSADTATAAAATAKSNQDCGGRTTSPD